MKKNIVLLPGDGIGPEVTRAAAAVLRECAHEFSHQFDMHEFPIGGAAIDATGTPLPAETLDACRKADAVFLGAVGGAKWDALPVGKRPESGLLELRKGMGLYVNVRPVKVLEPLRAISPLKPERLGDLDIEIVRELAGGMYFGERGSATEKGEERAWDTESYSTREIERIATFAFSRAESSLAALVLGGQSQCAEQFAAVAPHGYGHEHGVSLREARTHVRGQCRDAADPAAHAIRCDPQLQHVWRHFE